MRAAAERGTTVTKRDRRVEVNTNDWLCVAQRRIRLAAVARAFSLKSRAVVERSDDGGAVSDAVCA